MGGSPFINTPFDFGIDSAGRDPDKYSPTLRRYHRLLWSKPLPGGEMFALEDGGGCLLHHSDLGYFPVSSDSVTPTFTKHKRMAHLVDQFRDEDNETFVTLTFHCVRGAGVSQHDHRWQADHQRCPRVHPQDRRPYGSHAGVHGEPPPATWHLVAQRRLC